MRALFLILCIGLAACTDMPTSGGAPAAGGAPTGAQQAYFTSYPSALFAAAAIACNDPGQTAVQPSANEVRCESLPEPEAAAALILQYDGTVEDLPKFVIAFLGRNTPQGYLVTADSYIRVPQRNGEARQLRFEDARAGAELRRVLVSAGGRPL